MVENKDYLKSFTRKNGKKYTLKEDKYRFFYPHEYMKVHDKLKKKQQHTMTCLLNTGARINEMRNVKVSDIDFQNKRMVLRVTKAKARKKEKRGKIRTIPISTQFTRYLNRYCSKLNRESYLNILSTPAFNIGIKKGTNKAKLSNPNDFSAHNLRKTLETWLVALNIDGMKVIAHLGHDARTAAQSYISPDVFSYEEKQKMREIIGDLYTM